MRGGAKAKELQAEKQHENANLVGKLSSCTAKGGAERALHSGGRLAGGSAKQARDRAFQAILPLRGKPLNAEKKRIDQVLSNEEIRSIISALGTGIGEDFNLDNLKYHKVIILSDADQDGAHIKCILMTFFFRYMKELISNSHLYIGLPPLYKVETKSSVRYAYNNEELGQITRVWGKITRSSATRAWARGTDQLWETTMDPARRKLIRVSIEDAAEAEAHHHADGRQHRGEEEVHLRALNFNKQDSFRNSLTPSNGEAYEKENAAANFLPDIGEVSLEEVMHGSMIPTRNCHNGQSSPRVEDGLKPVQRRILYTMYELGLTPDQPYRNPARIGRLPRQNTIPTATSRYTTPW